jgi:hypothetical protein
MDRSPYNLTVPPKRRPPTRRAAHFQQKIDEDDVSHSTPPLHSDEPIADLNPIFQPQYGSAGRYGSSRSMKAKHTYTAKDAHTITVPETTKGRSTDVPGTGYNNHSHPLQWSAQDFRHSSSFQGQQPQHNQFLNNNQGQMSESNAIIKYLKTTLFKQLYQMLRQLQRPKNEKPVSDLWLDGTNKPLTGADPRSRFLRYILPCILLIIANAIGILPSRFFRRSRLWNRLEERHLNGRQCVMNLFVDKVSIVKIACFDEIVIY